MRLTTMNSRMCGKTMAICEAARMIDATVICASERHAQQIREKYGVKAISMNVQERVRVGSEEPYIWDDFAADLAWDDFNTKIEAIRKKYHNVKDNNTRQAASIKALKIRADELERELADLRLTIKLAEDAAAEIEEMTND